MAGEWRQRWPKLWPGGAGEDVSPTQLLSKPPAEDLPLCFNSSSAEPPSPISSLTNPAAITWQGPKARLPKVSTSFRNSKLRFQVLSQRLGLWMSGHLSGCLVQLSASPPEDPGSVTRGVSQPRVTTLLLLFPAV